MGFLTDRIEKAIGRYVADTIPTDGRDPANRSWRDERFERIPWQTMIIRQGFVKHCVNLCRI